MTTLVCFRAAGTRYAIRVSSTLAVRPAALIVGVPSESRDVVGILPGDPVLSVLSPLTVDADAAHVLVVTTPGRDFGLLVDAVTEVFTIDESAIRPVRDAGLVIGVVERPGGVLLLTDAMAIGGRP
ncbi:MAG: chemotaxis protein CheW [Ilumatobacteraceae bacterium]